LATGVAACSFSWGAHKSEDTSAKPAAAAQPAAPALDPAAKAAAAAALDAELAKASGLRKIAILPTAYNGADGGYACDLCPESVVMQPTSAEAAKLVTAFLYESIARHPRFLVVRYETVATAAAKGMRAAAADLASRGQADAVLIAALVALRPRVGDDEKPEKPAGASLFASLVDSRNGTVLWSGTFDEDETARNWFLRRYDRVVGGVPRKWHSAEGFTETGVRSLIDDLVDEVGE